VYVWRTCSVTELTTSYSHGADVDAADGAAQDVGAVMLSASETLDTE